MTLKQLHYLVDTVATQTVPSVRGLLVHHISAEQLCEIFLLAQSRLTELEHQRNSYPDPHDIHAPSS